MPGTPAVLTTVTSSVAATTLTSGTISPTASTYVHVALAGAGNIAAISVDSFSSTFAISGSWTIVNGISSDPGTRETHCAYAWAFTDGAPGSGTVTVTYNDAAVQRKVMTVIEVSSVNATPITQSKASSDSASPTALSYTFDSTPASAALILANIADLNGGGTTTPGTNFTELADAGSGGAGFAVTGQSQYDLVSPTTTLDWSSLGGANCSALGAEIADVGGVTIVKDIIGSGIIPFAR